MQIISLEESMRRNGDYGAAEEVTRLREANQRLQARAEELESRLYSALNALKELREAVPPKEFKTYPQAVLDLEARITGQDAAL